MTDKRDLSFVRSLYGGYWNYDLKDFCYMINSYFPPQEMLGKIAARLSVLSKNYPSTNKYISLLLSNYLSLDVDNLVVANGASELVNAIGRLFIKNLTISIPTFDEYINRLRIQGKEVSLYRMEEEERFTIDMDSYIRFAEESNSNAVLFIRPNNPTGNLIPKTSMNYALQKLVNFDLVLVDESFIEFNAGERDASILELTRTYENLVIIKSLSKVYGIPGLRIGCAICGNINRIDMLRKELSIWNINSFAQCFIELLGDYRKEFEEACTKVVRATRELHTELSKLKCLYPYPTEANFVFCKLANNKSSTELATFLFENYGFLIYDCSNKTGLNSQFVRIASRTYEENGELLAAIRAWEEWRG